MKKEILILILTVLYIGCSKEEVKTKKKEESKVVKIYEIDDNFNDKKSKTYPALIYSFQDSTMAFEVSGKITKFYFDEGDFIKKGAVIAKLDDTIYRANYNSALATYKQSKIDYDRFKKLFESKSIAKREFEKIKQTFKISKSNLEIAKKRLTDTKLTAEFNGIMAKKLVNDYARITVKQGIIKLQDNSAYKIKFFVPENDILSLEEKVTVKNASDFADFFINIGDLKENIPAKLIDISTTAEEVSRTFEVTLQIEVQKNKNILPGMTANVNVFSKGQNKKSIYIPLSAVFADSNNNSFVWLLNENNIISKQKVQLGNIKNDLIEIKNGLEKKQRVVTSGLRFLKDADKVIEYKKVGI